MTKIIKSQDGKQMHFMPANTPCYFNIAPVVVEGGKKGEEPFYSVGINNISFAIFKKEKTAGDALNELEAFLLNKSLCFQLPADK